MSIRTLRAVVQVGTQVKVSLQESQLCYT